MKRKLRPAKVLEYFDHIGEKTTEKRTMPSAKDAARQIIDHLPDEASWDGIMYEFHVKQKIEIGLKAADEGRVIAHEEARRRLLGDAG